MGCMAALGVQGECLGCRGRYFATKRVPRLSMGRNLAFYGPGFRALKKHLAKKLGKSVAFFVAQARSLDYGNVSDFLTS